VCTYVLIALVVTLTLSVLNGDSWLEGLKQGSFLPILPVAALIEFLYWRERRRARRPTRQNQ
jgi:hypothetical protein